MTFQLFLNEMNTPTNLQCSWNSEREFVFVYLPPVLTATRQKERCPTKAGAVRLQTSVVAITQYRTVGLLCIEAANTKRLKQRRMKRKENDGSRSLGIPCRASGGFLSEPGRIHAKHLVPAYRQTSEQATGASNFEVVHSAAAGGEAGAGKTSGALVWRCGLCNPTLNSVISAEGIHWQCHRLRAQFEWRTSCIQYEWKIQLTCSKEKRGKQNSYILDVAVTSLGGASCHPLQKVSPQLLC